MKITIDTNSQTDIKKAIKILSSLVEDSETGYENVGNALGTVFSEPTSDKEEPEKDEAMPKITEY